MENGRRSPDGQKVCFDASAGLYTMNVDGANKRLICADVEGMHPFWCTNGYIYLSGVGEAFRSSTGVDQVVGEPPAHPIVIHCLSANTTRRVGDNTYGSSGHRSTGTELQS